MGWSGALQHEGLERWLSGAEIAFVSANEWRWEEGRRIPRRRLPTSTVGWHHRGQGTVRVAGEAHRIRPHCLQIVPAGVWHDVVHEPGQPLASLGVHFQATLPGAGDLTALLGLPVCLAMDPAGIDAPALAAMQAMVRLDAVRPAGWRLLAQAELVRLLMHLLLHHGGDCHPAPAPRGEAARLAPALALIERELPRGPVAVADLALAAGVSAVHLRTLFRRATGQSPHRYVQARRVALACRLLRHDAAPVAAVARAVGVSEPRVFHRLFRQLTGTTPQRWRRELEG